MRVRMTELETNVHKEDTMYEQSYYEILGVDKEASQEKLKKAFIELALQYHPEINPGRESEAKFKAIYEAYTVLKDEAKRQEYDQIGQAYAGEKTAYDLSLESIFYEILGVARDASEREISKAFTKLAMQYGSALNPPKADNGEKLKKVYNTYTILRDKAKRREYERSDQDASSQENAQNESSALTIKDILYEIRELAEEFGLSVDENSIDPLGIFSLGKQVVNEAYWYGEHLLSDVLGIRIRGKVRRKH